MEVAECITQLGPHQLLHCIEIVLPRRRVEEMGDLGGDPGPPRSQRDAQAQFVDQGCGGDPRRPIGLLHHLDEDAFADWADPLSRPNAPAQQVQQLPLIRRCRIVEDRIARADPVAGIEVDFLTVLHGARQRDLATAHMAIHRFADRHVSLSAEAGGRSSGVPRPRGRCASDAPSTHTALPSCGSPRGRSRSRHPHWAGR